MTLTRLVPYAVAVLAIGAHAGILDAGFVYDDVPIVVENPQVASLDRAAEWFTTGYWPGHDLYYRPLVIAGYALERALFGLDAFAAHAINLAWHLVATLLVTHLVITTLQAARGGIRAARLGGGAAGVFFAVHPLLSEPVYWVSARSDLLGCTAVVGAILLARSERLGAVARAACVFLVALAGLLCKEIVAVLPGLLLLDAAWRRRHDPQAPGLRPALAGATGAVVALVAYAALRAAALDGTLGGDPAGAAASALHNPLAEAPAAARVFTPLAILSLAARHLVLAAPLSSDYAYDTIPLAAGIGDPRVLVGIGLVLGAIVAGTVSLRRSGVSAWGLGFAALTWLPASNTLVLGGALFGERFAYLPAAGLAVTFGGAAAGLARARPGLRVAAGAVLAIAVAACMRIDHARTGDWHDDAALYASVVEAYPRNAQGHYNLGSLALEAAAHHPAGHPTRIAHLEEAEARFRRAVEIFPRYLLARMNAGVARAERGDWAGALEAFEAAARIDARDAQLQYNLGLAHERLGARREAIRHYRESARLVPGGGPAAAALRRLVIDRSGR